MALMTVEELAKDSKISKFTWRRWLRLKKLPAINFGRRVRVAEEDYRAFLAAHHMNGAPARRAATKQWERPSLRKARGRRR
jgi:excisionase family DNA binding protein